MHKFSIKDWAVDDQPRQKLLNKGADTLSDSELLAILINNGTSDHTALDIAKNLLQTVENSLHRLAGMSVKEMVNLKIKGLGEAKAIALTAAL
ncbi:MAG: hypothetical protein JO301_15965, partial [Chitinophagaceae bacterium]|nr:hypothetical protein [Chitinophagaceae bacterium]